MIPAIHGLMNSNSLASFGSLEANWKFLAPTSTTDTDQANTIENVGGTNVFKSPYDFSGKGRRLPVPASNVNWPIYSATDGSVFDATRWFELLAVPSVTVRTIALKVKGIPANLATLNFCASFSISGTQDALFLGNATGALANETVSFLPPSQSSTSSFLATNTVPPSEPFTIIIRPIAKTIAINGVNVALMQPGASVVGTLSCMIGNRPGIGSKFTGAIQEVALWSTEVNAGDVFLIHEIMNA